MPLTTMLTFSDATHVQVDDRAVSAGLRAVVQQLTGAGATRDALRDLVWHHDGADGLTQLYYVLEQWAVAGVLCQTLVTEGQPLITWVPLAPNVPFGLDPVNATHAYILSRFVYCRRDGGHLVLESPLAHAQLRLHDGRGSALVTALSTPQTVQALGATLPHLAAETIETFTGLLHQVGMLAEVTAEGATTEDRTYPLATWEFHDLLFHSRSRLGRHANPVGRTYRFRGHLEPLPAVKPPMSSTPIALVRPDLATLEASDPPLSRVLEGRHSIRQHGEPPLSVEQLGTFLYRVARVRQLFDTPYGQLSSRPYPGGGAIYELELYVLVQRCTGLRPGLYHYAPQSSHLEPLGGPTPYTDALLHAAMAAAAWDPEHPPQVLLIIAARFARLAWKYASIAYALLLKHVGVLYQTMYLVATAMGLAPCAIGAGDADAFAMAAGTDYYAETSVGEFLLGSPRQTSGTAPPASEGARS